MFKELKESMSKLAEAKTKTGSKKKKKRENIWIASKTTELVIK